MKFVSFYFVRHGQTDFNMKGLVQGQAQIPLNESGKKQATDLAQKLSSLKFDFCYSSDLIRAKETAEILIKSRPLKVIEDHRLRERDIGTCSGKSIEVYLKYKLSNQNEIETDAEMKRRINSFIKEINVKYPNSNVLVVTHGGLMKRLLIDIKKEALKVIIKNASFLHLKVMGDTFKIISLDNIEII